MGLTRHTAEHSRDDDAVKGFPTTLDDVAQWGERPSRRSLRTFFVVTLLIAVTVPLILLPPAIAQARGFDELAAHTAQREDIHGDVISSIYKDDEEWVRVALADGTEVTVRCFERICFYPGESVTVTRHRMHKDVLFATSDSTGVSTQKLAHNSRIREALSWTAVAAIPLLFALLVLWREHRLTVRIRKIQLSAYGVDFREP